MLYSLESHLLLTIDCKYFAVVHIEIISAQSERNQARMLPSLQLHKISAIVMLLHSNQLAKQIGRSLLVLIGLPVLLLDA